MVSNLKLSLHAEPLAPLGATSSQHLAAALRRHTSTETVALSPLTSVRLIRALHIDSLSWFQSNLESIAHVTGESRKTHKKGS